MAYYYPYRLKNERPLTQNEAPRVRNFEARASAPKQVERKMSSSLAYAFESEQYARANFAQRLSDAYEHASKDPSPPAEVTTPARRGNYGATPY